MLHGYRHRHQTIVILIVLLAYNKGSSNIVNFVTILNSISHLASSEYSTIDVERESHNEVRIFICQLVESTIKSWRSKWNYSNKCNSYEHQMNTNAQSQRSLANNNMHQTIFRRITFCCPILYRQASLSNLITLSFYLLVLHHELTINI